jgi:hypothetical protein
MDKTEVKTTNNFDKIQKNCKLSSWPPKRESVFFIIGYEEISFSGDKHLLKVGF